MIRANTPRSSKTSVSKTNFETDTPTVRKKLITYIWYVSPSPRAEMNKELKPQSHTRAPSIKFLLLLHSPQATQGPILLLTINTLMITPKGTFLQSSQTYTRACARTRAFTLAHTSRRKHVSRHTHTHTQTHIHTRARMKEQTLCI